jgi:hypothetical protein
MKNTKLIVLFCFFCVFVHAQKMTNFAKLVDRYGMSILVPKGYEEDQVVFNDDMEYDYAIKSPVQDIVLRYALRPIINQAEKPFRNTNFKIYFQTVLLNISGGSVSEFTEFDSEAVKQEFSADWGATTLFEPKSEFGKGYKYCMVVMIHKNDVADAFYFYMTNTPDKLSQNMDPLFHTLKFK